MTTDQKIADLITKMTIVPDDAALSLALQNLSPGSVSGPVRVAFINAHAINLCYRNPEFLQDLLACDTLFRDGSGMKLLFKMIKRTPGLNLNGTDLIPRILGLYTDQSVALFGTASPYLEKAAEKIATSGMRPVAVMDGFQPEARYAEAAQASPAPLIVLAMGMPKQERVARHLAETLQTPCVIVCGGAILDFLGGKVSRAPEIFRKTGMEWVYRLMREPKRLFGRYVIGNFVFMFRMMRLAYLTKAF